jgi:hypothetical protein
MARGARPGRRRWARGRAAGTLPRPPGGSGQGNGARGADRGAFPSPAGERRSGGGHRLGRGAEDGARDRGPRLGFRCTAAAVSGAGDRGAGAGRGGASAGVRAALGTGECPVARDRRPLEAVPRWARCRRTPLRSRRHGYPLGARPGEIVAQASCCSRWWTGAAAVPWSGIRGG